MKNINGTNRKIREHQKGYILEYKPDHPFANIGGYIPQHRLVIEKKIGRFVDTKIEEVHHKNRNVKDNRLNNLELVSRSTHRRIHKGWKLINGKWWKPCNGCKKFLEFEENFYKRSNGYSVGRCKNCVFEYSRKIKGWIRRYKTSK